MKKKWFAGFTLLELLITIAIIGILASIAYPSYQNSIMRSRRTDGRVALMSAAGVQESYFTENNSYSSNIDDISGNSSAEGFYTLSVVNTNCSSVVNDVTLYSCFTITATATSSQSSDVACSTISLTHTGIKLPSECW